MNLPWDKSYFKICFYIIFTFICIYLAKNIIDGAIYTFINIDYIFIIDILYQIKNKYSLSYNDDFIRNLTKMFDKNLYFDLLVSLLI